MSKSDSHPIPPIRVPTAVERQKVDMTHQTAKRALPGVDDQDIVVVFGPEGCGKTHNAQKLMRVLSCETLVDGLRSTTKRGGEFVMDDGLKITNLPGRSLILTNMSLSECERYLDKHAALMPYATAIKLLDQ